MQNTNKHWTKNYLPLEAFIRWMLQICCTVFFIPFECINTWSTSPARRHRACTTKTTETLMCDRWLCGTRCHRCHQVSACVRALCVCGISESTTHTHTHAHNVTCQLRAEGRYPQTMCWDMKLQSCTTRVNLRQKINKRSTRTFWH